MGPLKGTTYVAAETTPKPPGERVPQKRCSPALSGCGLLRLKRWGVRWEIGWWRLVGSSRIIVEANRMQTMRWDHRGVSDVVQATWWVLTYSSIWCELRGVSYVAGANVLVNVV